MLHVSTCYDIYLRATNIVFQYLLFVLCVLYEVLQRSTSIMLNPDEQLIDFATARERSSIPRTVGIGCWYRWALKGINGVRLEHVRIGRRLFTTMGGVARFVAAMNAPAEPPAPSLLPRKKRQQSLGRRKAEIAAAQDRWNDLSGSAA